VTTEDDVNVAIEAGPGSAIAGVAAGASAHFRANLRRSVSLTPDTKHLEWIIVDGGPLQFRAGQFVTARVETAEGTEIRPYSIASPPRDDLRFELCINRVNRGYVSNYLCDLKAGSVVDFKGPYGLFVISQPIERDVVFLATGTGVAPFRSMLMDLYAKGNESPHEVWLIFGVRFVEGLLYREEFEELQQAHPRFHFVPVVSRPSAEWAGARGHVQDQLQKAFTGRKNFTAYVCGVKAMVDEVRAILKNEFGLPRDQIRSEQFV
jgi:ferredoxin-NADP reductase